MKIGQKVDLNIGQKWTENRLLMVQNWPIRVQT